MNILFMGTPDYAAEILKAILEKNYKISALVCQPDKKAGRGNVLKTPATKELVLAFNEKLKQDSIESESLDSMKNSDSMKNLDSIESKNSALNSQKNTQKQIKILQPQKLDSAACADIVSFSPDLILVAAFGQILPLEILNLAPCVNLHASILPHFRGASPIAAQILADEKFFGISAMRMRKGLDCGEILGFCVVKNKNQSAEELFLELAHAASILSLKIISEFHKIDSIESKQNKNNLIENFGEEMPQFPRLAPLVQRECESSYCAKIQKNDALIDFSSHCAKEIALKARAYAGWPGIFLASGVKLFEVKVAEYIESKSHKPGEIVEISKNGLKIATKLGAVVISRLQSPGKKPLNAEDFANGKRLKIGDILC